MDLFKTIKELQEEKRRIDVLIEILEQRLACSGSSPAPGRRGRKSMSEAERKEVSRRMRAYWAARRQQRQETEGGSENNPV